MMRLLLGIFVLLLAACATVDGPPHASAPTRQAPQGGPASVLLLSIDGFRPDYLDRGLTPSLVKLAARGVRAEWMTPSFPALTFPNHYTLVTGLRPDRHGIVAGTIVDPEIPGVRFTASNRDAVRDSRWWSQGVPLWVTAQQAGLIAGTMFWPGSEASNLGMQPNDWFPYVKAMPAAERVDTALSLLARPVSTRPRLLTLYLDTIDIVGHAHGPDSPEIDAALRELDAAVARLLVGIEQQGLTDRVNLVVVSDHGMAAGGPNRVIVADDVVPADWIQTQIVGELAGFQAKPGREAEVEGRLLRDHPNMQCWRKGELPERFHYGRNPRVLPLVCMANEGWTMKTREWLAGSHRVNGGSHGYDPALLSMRALFIAAGPAFPRGRVVPAFDNVEVYPLLARLLGVKPLPGDWKGDLAERLPIHGKTP